MKKTVGLIEKVIVYGKNKSKTVFGKFDTGAKLSSIDSKLAEELGIGPILNYTKITSASNQNGLKRPIVELELEILGEKYKTLSTLVDRSRMKYPLLLGRELMHSKFIVDVSKTNHTPNESDINVE